MGFSVVQRIVLHLFFLVTLDIIIRKVCTFVVSSTGAWMNPLGGAGTVLFLLACVIFAFPSLVSRQSSSEAQRDVRTFWPFFKPWLMLRLFWTPLIRGICCLAGTFILNEAVKNEMVNYAQLTVGALCLAYVLFGAISANPRVGINGSCSDGDGYGEPDPCDSD